jgi:hypothetical protein
MRWLDTRWMVMILAIAASGCLLPQPDTPWVPPAATTGAAAPQEDAQTGVPAATPVPTEAPSAPVTDTASPSPSPSPSRTPSPSPAGKGAVITAPVQ